MVLYLTDDQDAARHLRRARRVLVIGCSGGGKSTLSRALAQMLDLRNISMDREIFWLPGWAQRPRSEQRGILRRMIAEDRWLMDGTNPSSFDLRLPRTDLVLWVRLPRWRCLLGVYRRALKNHGRSRVDMADGCVERFPDGDFLSYIWHFEGRFAPRIIAEINRHGPEVPVFLLKSHDEIRRLLDLVEKRA